MIVGSVVTFTSSKCKRLRARCIQTWSLEVGRNFHAFALPSSSPETGNYKTQEHRYCTSQFKGDMYAVILCFHPFKLHFKPLCFKSKP